MAMVANGKISVLLWASWYHHEILQFKKLTRSKPFHLYSIEKNTWWGGGGRMERYLS